MVIWALFDSGNGCYQQAVEKYFPDQFDIYSIGIDKESKNNHFIYLNLADYSELFDKGGESQLFRILDQLPNPDILLASPPCESWSVASAMQGGNICWCKSTIETLFGTHESDNHFALRTYKDFEARFKDAKGFKPYWWKAVYNRINGELCAFNTMRIIERYRPEFWVIENPQSSRLWRYYKQIHQFEGFENVAHYHAYDDHFPRKPTTFYSNVFLDLRKKQEPATVVLNHKGANGRRVLNSYNERSNIPLLLIKEILETLLAMMQGDYEYKNFKVNVRNL